MPSIVRVNTPKRPKSRGMDGTHTQEGSMDKQVIKGLCDMTPWDTLKAKVKTEVQQTGKLFVNPRKRAKEWQAGMELVGKGELKYDGCYFYPL